MQTDAVAGAILGCAVGDALGLPYEGLSSQRAVRLLGEPDRYRFLLGRGMVSDDTEHTCMVAESLCEHPCEDQAFAAALARRLRWWLLGVPAGIGLATLRACGKLWLGYSPSQSGVFSAGNGPAMRSGVLGAAIEELDRLKRYVMGSTLVTHTDPKAWQGAYAVALAAWCARRGEDTPEEYLEKYRAVTKEDGAEELRGLLARMGQSVRAGESTAAFALGLGCRRGVSGYVMHSVPVALHAWLRQPRDYGSAVREVIGCGGDTDTTGAMVGAIVGSGVGRAGIPGAWRKRLWEWPRTVEWMERLAWSVEQAMQTGQAVRPPAVTRGLGLVRNGVFLSIVLGHAARRMLPPY